jgi:enoyl-CoA hydratase/carnithine racemase
MRYLLTGDEFTAQTARSLGFVQEIVDPGEERSVAIALAKRISDCAPLAVKAVIENARSGLIDGETDAHRAFGTTQRTLVNTQDFEEGVKSFLQKREANFRGE